MGYKEDFIGFMLKSDVLKFGEFVTKSGRETPYFINTGNYKTGAQVMQLGEFYAACIDENIKCGNISPKVKALFGPAYKGIPIATSTSIALYSKFDREVGYMFNRKEEKDHGEGGNLVGYKPAEGDEVIIVEDVITAGTAIRQILPTLKMLKVKIAAVIVSVDRMEKGQNEKTAIMELEEEFGIKTFPIVNIVDIIKNIEDRQLDDRFETLITPKIRGKIYDYMNEYCILHK
ncbi:MAG: orotate phosphoribosyltransferase [Eubacteriales bacterium]